MQPAKFTRRALAGLGLGLLASPVAARQDAALTGQVIVPGDPAYADARLTFNLRTSRYPRAIVICGTVGDVQQAVRWARARRLPFRARSGGHSYEGYSVPSAGLVIDLGGLNAVIVDAAAGTAVVGAGVRLLDLYRRLFAAGFSLPAGTCPGVGISGLTLGGGVGFRGREFGLTCDNLLAVALVDGKGRTLQASASENPDLYWALRGGGGGNFGIATSFTFRVQPARNHVLCEMSWPWEEAGEVLSAWQDLAPHVDHRLTVGLGIGHPSQGAIYATALCSGSEAEATSLLAPLLAAGHPNPPRLRTVTSLQADERLAGRLAAHSTFKNSSAMIATPLPPEAIATLIAHLRAAPSPDNVVGCFPLGGAVAAVPADATAFAHRSALYDLQYQAYWSAASEASANLAWVERLRAAMAPYASGAYVNYIDAAQPDWATAYYGANLPRLQRVKAAYDPDNVFNGPQTIPVL